MKVKVGRRSVDLRVDFSRGRSLAIPLDPSGRHPRFFADVGVKARPLSRGDFVGDMKRGASCNAEVFEFSAHSHGTHTECIGHVLPEHQSVIGTVDEAPALMRLVTIPGEALEEGGLIPASALGDLAMYDIGALALRTLPNDAEKQWRNYDEAPDFPVLSQEAVAALCESSLVHLLIDTPSLDHPKSQGLPNHATWWGLYARVRPGIANPAARTVTEMIFVPDDVDDGLYWLDLQLAPFVSDAVPSRPVIYPVHRIELAQYSAPPDGEPPA